MNHATKYLKKMLFLLLFGTLFLQACAVGVGFGQRHYYHHHTYDGRYIMATGGDI